MRRQLATLVLAAAIGPVLGGFLPRTFAQVTPPVAAAAPAAASAVPVKRVVLYTSGVGYFEHFGTSDGAAAVNVQSASTAGTAAIRAICQLMGVRCG